MSNLYLYDPDTREIKQTFDGVNPDSVQMRGSVLTSDSISMETSLSVCVTDLDPVDGKVPQEAIDAWNIRTNSGSLDDDWTRMLKFQRTLVSTIKDMGNPPVQNVMNELLSIIDSMLSDYKDRVGS